MGCSGFLYEDRKNHILISLIAAMIVGRIISGIANYILLTVGGSTFVLGAFLTTSFVKGLLGIIIQIIFIPIIVKCLKKVSGGGVINE